MNQTSRLLAAATVAAVAFAACAGGGVSTAPNAASVPANTARNTVTVPPASVRKSYGTANLLIKFPAVLTGKNAKAIRALANASATHRSPKYVNPTSGDIIDIFVDGSLVPNIDGNFPDNNDSLLVQSSSDGSQSVVLPLFSNQNNQIVVVEWDQYYDFVLAEGETDLGGFIPGQPQNPSVTLLMNTEYIGIVDTQTQSDPETMYGQLYYGLRLSCGSSGPASQFGVFSADGDSTFVADAGYGGTALPTLSSTPNSPGTTTAGQTAIAGVYQVSWDPNCDGVTVSASVQSPAAAIVSGPASSENYGAPIVNGNSTYAYYYCYFGDGSCPGGPYQGLWNMRWEYDLSSYPTQYAGQPPQNSLNSGGATGTVVVTASSPP